MLAELHLCWKILDDFNQVLAPLCKGLIYGVSFQASLEDRINQKNHKHIQLAAFLPTGSNQNRNLSERQESDTPWAWLPNIL